MQSHPVKRPPGPTWRHLGEILHQDPEFYNLEYPLILTRRYGGFVYSSPFKLYLVSEPDVFEHILKTNAKNYVRQKLVYNHMKLFFGNSLVVTEGNAWRYRRRMALPAYQHQTIKSYIPTITHLSEKLLTTWRSSLPKKINLLATLNSLTLNIASQLFCNQELPPQTLAFLGKAIRFCNDYCSFSQWIHPLKPTLNNWRFFWYTKKIDEIFLPIIRARRKNSTPYNDLLDHLIHATSEETGGPLTDQEVLAEFKTHIITGHETTGCSLSWMWYLLAQNPQYRELLEEELESVLNGRLPTLEDIPKLVVTQAILSETFRLYPPIWSLARTNIEADSIQGYEIPPNSRITLHLYALHRNPAYWDCPNDFCPERFLEPETKRHPFSYIPFSSGSHTCIASHLATQESILLAATLAQTVRFELVKKTEVFPKPCITLSPIGGIPMRPILRDKSMSSPKQRQYQSLPTVALETNPT